MSIIQILGSGGSGPSWPLDAYTTSLAYAYARKRLLSSYSGALYRVRRDSDNTEQDITPDSHGSDLASLTSFVGSASAYVTKWYDQSGNSLDLAQTTTTKQPQVVATGFVFTNFQPDGVDDFLQNTSLPSYSNGLTTYLVGQPAPVVGSGNPIVFQSGGTKAQIFAYAPSSVQTHIIVATGDMLCADQGLVDTGRSWATDLTQSGFDNQNKIRAAQSNVATGTFTNNYSSAAFDAGDLTLFSGPSGSGNPSPARPRALVGYNAAHSNTTADSISTILEAYYSSDVGPLGPYTNALVIAGGISQLLSGWAGALIQVRRDSDNTTTDIGYVSGGGLDTASLLAFVGSGNGFVSKIYDQSGNGNNIVQASASLQPAIVTAGTYLGDIEFDGVNDLMTYSSPAAQSISIAGRMKLRTTSGSSFQPLINSLSNGTAPQQSYYIQYQTSDSKLGQYIFNGGSAYTLAESPETTTETVDVFCLAAQPGIVNTRFSNGSIKTGSYTGSGTVNGAFFAHTAAIGGSTTNADYSALSIKSFVLWACDQQGVVAGITAAL